MSDSSPREYASKRLRPYLTQHEWQVYTTIREELVALETSSPLHVMQTNTTSRGAMSSEQREVYDSLSRALPKDSWPDPREWQLRGV